MLTLTKKSGFSLVEILVSLLVVSLAAVNISGLQKMVGEQSRDNFTHSAVLALATEKMEEVLESEAVTDIDALHNSEESLTLGFTTFDLHWAVTALSSTLNAGADIRDVALQVSWNDAQGDLKSVTYSEQVNLALPFNTAGAGPAPSTVSVIGKYDVLYFEPKMGYKRDAYVIYNDQLFQATAVHQLGNGDTIRDVIPPINTDGTVNSGWANLGPVDNPALLDLFDCSLVRC